MSILPVQTKSLCRIMRMRGMSIGSMFFWKHTRREKKRATTHPNRLMQLGPIAIAFV